MPNGHSMCCALRDHLRVDPHWQIANPSPTACIILFQHWVLTDRNVLPSLSPIERLTCPLLWCGLRFADEESLLRHLRDCPKLPASGYWCPRCHRAESFATTRIPEVIPRLDNQSPVHKKPSGLRKLFCKPFSRKRATDPREDPTTKPEPFLQEMPCDRGLEMNTHPLHNDPRLYNTIFELDFRNVIVEKECNSPGSLVVSDSPVELPAQPQQPTQFTQREVAGSGANESNYTPISSRFLDRVSGQPEPPSYENEYFSEPENPLRSPANLDSAPRPVFSGYGSAPAPSLVPNCMEVTMDPQLASTTMNVSPQNSPLSASSSQTNTTWSGESTVTAVNSVTTFSGSCSPNSVSPRHISKSSAKSSGSSPKGKFHCQSCGQIFTDRANLGRHKKRHSTGNSIPCRAGCGIVFTGARTDNEVRHYHKQLYKEQKESETKFRGLIHLDYSISIGKVIRCRAGCGELFEHDNDEAGHYTTQKKKEQQEGDTIRKLMHLEFAILHSDVVYCRAGCGMLFTHDDDELTHYNTQVAKELEEGYRIHLEHFWLSVEALGLDYRFLINLDLD